MHLPNYLHKVQDAELTMAHALRTFGEGHQRQTDLYYLCQTQAEQSQQRASQLNPIIKRYDKIDHPRAPKKPRRNLLPKPRKGSYGLFTDLHDLYLLAQECKIHWAVLKQAAMALRDDELLHVVESCKPDAATQADWLRTRINQAAPMALIISS